MEPADARAEGLLSWQWGLYPAGHRDRRNLTIHILTVPLFQLGTLAVLAAPFTSWLLAPIGLATMAGVMALQGRGHKLEATRPVPFRGPLDVAARILVEQWFTFPRYVLSGGFARAWRATTDSAGCQKSRSTRPH